MNQQAVLIWLADNGFAWTDELLQWLRGMMSVDSWRVLDNVTLGGYTSVADWAWRLVYLG